MIPHILKKLGMKVSRNKIKSMLKAEGISVGDSTLNRALKILTRNKRIKIKKVGHGKALYWV